VTVALRVDTVESVTLNVTCSANVGGVLVFARTQGSASDPDDYVVSVGATSQPLLILPTASVLFQVPPGDYPVALSSVHDVRCFVLSANPQSVSVAYGTTSVINFAIDCTGQNGRLRVTTSTTGTNLDPDGYFVEVAGQTIGFSNDYTFDFAPVAVGDHVVTLMSVASNCSVNGPNPRTVTVVPNPAAETTFDVVCGGPPPVILFESDRDGDLDIYRVNPDGSGLAKLTMNDAPIDDEDPSWSWDNREIVFRSDRSGESEIWVMSADGSTAPEQITNSAEDDHNPAFSPGDSLIVYDAGDEDAGTLQIWIGNASGTNHNPRQLTFPPGIARNPSFNKDGDLILFESDRDGDFDLYSMDLNGQIVTQLTNTPGEDVDGSWSPVGTRIVYARKVVVGPSIWFVNRTGPPSTPFPVAGARDWQPVFSPDGSQIVFMSDRDGSSDLFSIDAAGLGVPVKLGSNTLAIDEDPELMKPVP
jgi:hypothetical protein